MRLNAQGGNVAAIAEIFECQAQTVRLTLGRWKQGGLGKLWDASGRGAKPKWKEEDIAYLAECLETDGRTYNSAQLAAKLEQERQVKLSADRIAGFCKKGVPMAAHSALPTTAARLSAKAT